uniref:Immunoglobulin domain-containing protein n=1 Tax=Sinocyclocheilus rhinocerous TaxID=307959 RepID=A0A673HP26_9TELE
MHVVFHAESQKRYFKQLLVCVSDAPDAELGKMKTISVMEGEAVTLDPGVIKNPNDEMTWYFNETLIAEITGDQSKICTDDQCRERFRDRLKLDHQTGSLTITNTRTTDSGLYKLQIISRIPQHSVNKVTMMKGDSVTLQTGVKTIHLEDMKWYCNNIHRLKLDHQTGSLTIRDIKTTESGEYELKVINNSSINVSAAEQDQMKRKSVEEGESVTLDPGVIKNPNDVMTWYCNDTFIAEITGDQSKICTDDQCEERFRDRLKLDHQTGSLTIRDIRTTDSGLYRLVIISSSSSNSKISRVAVHGESFNKC